MTYLDSSVLIRMLLGQPNAYHLPPDASVISSSLLKVECLRAIHRLRIQYSLNDSEVALRLKLLYDALSSIDLMAVEPPILERASQAFPVSIKTLDAIHLSTALVFAQQEQQPIVMLTHDIQLGRAARSMGLEVLGC